MNIKNNKIMNIDIDDLREDLFTDYIQNYDHLSNDEISEMVDKEIQERLYNELIKKYY